MNFLQIDGLINLPDKSTAISKKMIVVDESDNFIGTDEIPDVNGTVWNFTDDYTHYKLELHSGGLTLSYETLFTPP